MTRFFYFLFLWILLCFLCYVTGGFKGVNMQKSNERIAFLDYLRLIACFMVMVIHAVEPYYIDFSNGDLSIATRADAIWVCVFEGLARSCVPLFVMASCYLLFPLKVETGRFLRRRASRILIPFVAWSLFYVWHCDGNIKKMLFNFPMAAGHLWFVPMLFGLYLAMPLLSPWAERASKGEIKMWIGVWLFTELFPCLRRLSLAFAGDPSFGSVAYLWGECPWNEFGAFQYVSGFFGYMLIALYFRKFVPELSWRKTLAVALPLFAAGFAIMAGGFYFRLPDGGFPVRAPYAAVVDIEMSIEYCSIGVTAALVGLFLIIRKFTADGAFYRFVIVPMSEASYGTYLIHMIFLAPISEVLKVFMPMPVAVLAVAAIVFVSSSTASFVVRKIPFIGKYLMG